VEEINKDVQGFIAEHIDSVVQLEVLLLTHSRPQQSWVAADIARELRISTAWTEAALAKLAAAGILTGNGPAYRYAPSSDQLARTITALAKAYEDRRVTIISMIFSKPPDPIRQFTDAFRFRKDGES
jgi:hypothetical protein